MVFPQSNTPQSEGVLRLDGMRLRLADQEILRNLKVQRAWDVQRVKRQPGDPDAEFSIPVSTFNQGYGYSYALSPGAYEKAHQWDTSAYGKAKTWAGMAESVPFESGTNRGWIYYSPQHPFAYVFRGRYAVKYEFSPLSGSEWSILEIHDFGEGMAVAGRWGEFNGAVYVPLMNASTQAEERFHQLATVNFPTPGEQTLTMTGSPDGGTFTIEFDSGYGPLTTAALPFDITAEDMQAALRALPGLQFVTVERSGMTTDFIWTITLTAAPTEDGTDEPPTLVVNDSGLSGGTMPAIAVAVVANGLGDEWNIGPSNVVARYFTEWQKPGVGPTLNLIYEHYVRTVANDPMNESDWSASYPVGSSTYRCTAITTWNRNLIVGKQDGAWVFDEQADAVPLIKSIMGIVDDQNFVNMLEHNASLVAPHKLGTLLWSPSGWRFVGAEQDGAFEGERTNGWGWGMGLAPYGRYLYEVIADADGEHSIISSLQAPGTDERGPLVPHMHFDNPGLPEDVATITQADGLRSIRMSEAASDDTVGDNPWNDPENALSDGEYAEVSEVGTAEYLRLEAPAAQYFPDDAAIESISIGLAKSTSAPGIPAFETISARASATAIADTTLIWIDTPTGTKGGDILVAMIGGSSEDIPTFTPPPGWTVLNNATMPGVRYAIYWRRAGGVAGEPTTDPPQSMWWVTRGAVTGGVSIYGKIARISGVPAGTAIDAVSAGAAGSPTISIPSVTTTVDDCGVFVVAFGANTGQTFSGPSGTVEETDAGGFAIFSYTQAAGASGVKSVIGSAGGGGGFQFALRPGVTAGIVEDNSVRLLVGGTYVGDNLATSDPWQEAPQAVSYTSTGAGPLTGADLNTGLGFGISAEITNGSARVWGRPAIVVRYSVGGSQFTSSILVELRVDAETRSIASLHGYRLPRGGLTASNDPAVEHRVADATLHLSRIYAPSRNVQKTWRAIEFYVDLEPEALTPGFEMHAAIDDGEEFPLVDERGDRLTVRESGAYEGFLPAGHVNSGRWIQPVPVVPELGAGEGPVAIDLRDVALHGSWSPKTTDLVEATVVIDNDSTSDPLTGGTMSPAQVLRRLIALAGPRPEGALPITLHDPETDEDTTCVVVNVAYRRIQFQEPGAPKFVATIALRKTPSP